MTPRDLAMRYLEIFCSGQNIDMLRELLADDLSFRGPLHRSATAADYLEALRADPPQAAEFKLMGCYDDATSACLVYQYTKQGVCVPMAQMFKVRDGRISEILLVFDTGGFA